MHVHSVVFPMRRPELVYYVDEKGYVYTDPSHSVPVEDVAVEIPAEETAEELLIRFVGANLREDFESPTCDHPQSFAGSTELHCYFPIPSSGLCSWEGAVNKAHGGHGPLTFVKVKVTLRRISTLLRMGAMGTVDRNYVRFTGVRDSGVHLADALEVDNTGKLIRHGETVDSLHYEVGPTYPDPGHLRLSLRGSNLSAQFVCIEGGCASPGFQSGFNELIFTFDVPRKVGHDCVWRSDVPTWKNGNLAFVTVKVTIRRLSTPVT